MGVTDIWDLLLWPFLACLVLTGIHCYLGIHIVRRGVIFVDLAMAQIAFLGSTTAVLFWQPEHSSNGSVVNVAASHPGVERTDGAARSQKSLSGSVSSLASEPPGERTSELITERTVEQLIPPDPGSPDSTATDQPGDGSPRSARSANALPSGTRPAVRREPPQQTASYQVLVPYLGGLLFTLLGAALFSLGRLRHRQIPQEAVIGIIYAVSSALALVLLYEAPADVAEQTRDMLVGRLLFVNQAMVIETAGLYAVVGLLHFFLRRPFLMISFQPEAAKQAGMAVRWWDFLFYATFGMIVTSSVQMAGILLVFSYLIIPAVCAMLFFQDLAARLCFGWGVGFLASVAGIGLSVYLDIPTGASIVITFGGLLIALVTLRFFLVRWSS